MSSKISLPELKTLCKENNIKGYSKLKKNEIIELLKENKIEIKDSKREDITDVTEKLKKLEVKDKKIESKDEEIDEKMKNPLIEYYEFKDEKSEKFWEIKYDNIDEEKIKYIVKYGKIKTSGSVSKPKMDNIKNIEKIIETKVKKGYKLVN